MKLKTDITHFIFEFNKEVKRILTIDGQLRQKDYCNITGHIGHKYAHQTLKIGGDVQYRNSI